MLFATLRHRDTSYFIMPSNNVKQLSRVTLPWHALEMSSPFSSGKLTFFFCWNSELPLLCFAKFSQLGFRAAPSPPPRTARISSTLKSKLYQLFHAAAHRKFANTKHESVQLCLLNNNGITLLDPVALGLYKVFKRSFQEQQWRRHFSFYAGRTKRSCHRAALNPPMCRFAITNRVSQAHKSDRCFVYFSG